MGFGATGMAESFLLAAQAEHPVAISGFRTYI
jgi:hypothetical protein